MQRPPSIVRYEQLYFAALAVGLLNTALGWGGSTASFAANPVLADMTWLLPLGVAIGLAVRLTLWYFTARVPSAVARWATVAMAALSGLALLFGIVALIAGATPSVAAAVAGLVSGALYIVATAYLFRPDARAWFGEPDNIDREEPNA